MTRSHVDAGILRLQACRSRRAALQGAGALALAGALARPAGAGAQGTPRLATPAAAGRLLPQWAAGWSHLGDPSLLLGIVTDDVTYEDVAAGDVLHGRAALQQLLATARQAIPNFTVTLWWEWGFSPPGSDRRGRKSAYR